MIFSDVGAKCSMFLSPKTVDFDFEKNGILNTCWLFEIPCFFMTDLRSKIQKLSLREILTISYVFSLPDGVPGPETAHIPIFEKMRFLIVASF